MWAEEPFIPAIIKRVDADGISAYSPTMGQTIDFGYEMGLPKELPKVGSIWYIQRTARQKFTLYKEYNGENVSFLEMGMLVECGEIYGTEDAFIKDVIDLGVQEVHLVAATSGSIFWESECAQEIQLNNDRYNLKKLLVGLKKQNIKCVVAIDCKLWVDRVERLYNQQLLDENNNITYSSYLSLRESAENICKLVKEINQFGEYISYLEFINLKIDTTSKYIADVNAANLSSFFEKTGKGCDFKEIKKEYEEWINVQQESLDYFLNKVNLVTQFDLGGVFAKGRFGGTENVGIQTNMIELIPLDRAGQFISYNQSHNRKNELQSLAFHLACLKASNSPVQNAFIDIEDVDRWEDIFYMLSQYDVKKVIFDNYSKYRKLHEVERREMQNSYSANAASKVYSGDSSAFILSSSSLIQYTTGLGSDETKCQELWDSIEKIYIYISDVLGHHVDIIFDNKMYCYGREYKSVIYPLVSIFTNDDYERLAKSLKDEGQGTVLIGIKGQSDIEDVFNARIIENFEQEGKLLNIPLNMSVFGNDMFYTTQNINYDALYQKGGADKDTAPVVKYKSNSFLIQIFSGFDDVVCEMIGGIALASVEGVFNE